MKDEKYDFDTGEEGLSYDLLDECFNTSTNRFLFNTGLTHGMKV